MEECVVVRSNVPIELFLKVAKDALGHKGLITGREEVEGVGLMYVGFEQSTGLPWASVEPELIDEIPSPRALIAWGWEPEWEVVQDTDFWTLSWFHGVMVICPSEWPMGLAIDAATEFMDRYRENNIPRRCETPGDLMRFCAGEAKRQR